MSKSNRPSKAHRRNRSHSQPGTAGWAVLDLRSVPAGPGITSASLEEVLAAVNGFDPGLGWDAIADRVIPLFQRVRPYPVEFPDGVRTILPPGLSVSFAVDMGPAFAHVTQDFLLRWDVSLDAVRDQALRNLERRATEAVSSRLVTEPVDGVPLRTLQSGSGSASTFVLVPHLLPAIFGPQPQFFIAPMRDVLISLPADVNRDFATWLMGEFAALDPNHLAPIGFAYRAGRITVEPLEEALAMA